MICTNIRVNAFLFLPSCFETPGKVGNISIEIQQNVKDLVFICLENLIDKIDKLSHSLMENKKRERGGLLITIKQVLGTLTWI